MRSLDFDIGQEDLEFFDVNFRNYEKCICGRYMIKGEGTLRHQFMMCGDCLKEYGKN